MELLTPGPGLFIWQLFIILGVGILPLVALIDILRNRFDGLNKLIWVLVVIFVPFVGALLYLFMGKSQRVKS